MILAIEVIEKEFKDQGTLIAQDYGMNWTETFRITYKCRSPNTNGSGNAPLQDQLDGERMENGGLVEKSIKMITATMQLFVLDFL